MKKLVVALLVGTIWFSSGMQVDAAGPKDAGKAKHHAEHSITQVVKENIDNGVAFGAHKYEDPGKDWDDDKKAAKHHTDSDKKDKKDKDDKKDKNDKHDKKDKDHKNPSMKPGKKPHQNQKPEVNEPALGTTETTMLPDGSWYVSEFDADGVMTKRSFYYANGELERYFTCQYDENGQVLREDFYDAQGILTSYSQHEYLNDGTFAVTTLYNSDGTIAINQHDQVNNTHDLICYNADGTFAGWCQWNIDENGEYYDYREFNEDGSLLQEYELGVDENGNPIFVPEGAVDMGFSETTMIDGGGWYVSEFDANGFMTKRTFYYANGEMERYFTCQYDANGQLLGENYYDAQDVLTTYSQYEYLNDGTFVVTTMYNTDGTIAINQHDYVNSTHDLICYNADGSFAGWCQWNIDENGEYYDYREFNEDGSLLREYELSVDENGNSVFVPEGSDDNGGTGYTGVDEYVNSDGSKVVYEYENGLVLKSSFYNAAGELTDYTIFAYDENNRAIGHTLYDGNGNMLGQTENIFDENDNIVESRYVDNAGFVAVNKYDNVNGYHETLYYDPEGNFISHDVYRLNENYEYVEAWSYDEAGNVIAEYDVVMDADGNYTLIPKEA